MAEDSIVGSYPSCKPHKSAAMYVCVYAHDSLLHAAFLLSLSLSVYFSPAALRGRTHGPANAELFYWNYKPPPSPSSLQLVMSCVCVCVCPDLACSWTQLDRHGHVCNTRLQFCYFSHVYARLYDYMHMFLSEFLCVQVAHTPTHTTLSLPLS